MVRKRFKFKSKVRNGIQNWTMHRPSAKPISLSTHAGNFDAKLLGKEQNGQHPIPRDDVLMMFGGLLACSPEFYCAQVERLATKFNVEFCVAANRVKEVLRSMPQYQD
jgi:hypothetical protein